MDVPESGLLLKAEQSISVYDISGNLVGITDPGLITPVEETNEITKRAAATSTRAGDAQ